MSSDIGSRLRSAMARGYSLNNHGFANDGVTELEKLRPKSPELRQLRQLRVESSNSEIFQFPIFEPFEKVKIEDFRNTQNQLPSGEEVFLGPSQGYDVTDVTGVTPPVMRRNKKVWLRVEDPFNPVSITDYEIAFAKLQSTCPVDVSDERWRVALSDTVKFMNNYAGRASALGWSFADIFQIPSSERLMGLIWSINGDQIIGVDNCKAYFAGGRIFDRSDVNPFLWSKRKYDELLRSLINVGKFEEAKAQELAEIFTSPQNKDYVGLKWRKAQAGAIRFAVDWAPQAGHHGWSFLDMFSLHPEKPASRYDYMGLAWLLGDEWRVKNIDLAIARIENTRGAILTYRRKFF